MPGGVPSRIVTGSTPSSIPKPSPSSGSQVSSRTVAFGPARAVCRAASASSSASSCAANRVSTSASGQPLASAMSKHAASSPHTLRSRPAAPAPFPLDWPVGEAGPAPRIASATEDPRSAAARAAASRATESGASAGPGPPPSSESRPCEASPAYSSQSSSHSRAGRRPPLSRAASCWTTAVIVTGGASCVRRPKILPGSLGPVGPPARPGRLSLGGPGNTVPARRPEAPRGRNASHEARASTAIRMAVTAGSWPGPLARSGSLERPGRQWHP
ncbi:MAG: hypothetical protein JWO49_1373 [Arthrobacter sp.]|nr:hypothetical protein [Arthrobacter sp.]